MRPKKPLFIVRVLLLEKQKTAKVLLHSTFESENEKSARDLFKDLMLEMPMMEDSEGKRA